MGLFSMWLLFVELLKTGGLKEDFCCLQKLVLMLSFSVHQHGDAESRFICLYDVACLGKILIPCFLVHPATKPFDSLSPNLGETDCVPFPFGKGRILIEHCGCGSKPTAEWLLGG